MQIQTCLRCLLITIFRKLAHSCHLIGLGIYLNRRFCTSRGKPHHPLIRSNLFQPLLHTLNSKINSVYVFDFSDFLSFEFWAGAFIYNMVLVPSFVPRRNFFLACQRAQADHLSSTILVSVALENFLSSSPEIFDKNPRFIKLTQACLTVYSTIVVHLK